MDPRSSFAAAFYGNKKPGESSIEDLAELAGTTDGTGRRGSAAIRSSNVGTSRRGSVESLRGSLRNSQEVNNRRSSIKGLGRRESSQAWNNIFSDLPPLEEDEDDDETQKQDDTWKRRSSVQSNVSRRMSSWMMDGDIQKFLNDVNEEENQKPSIDHENKEILEQYKMMAHIEAYERVKEMCGYDREEYMNSKKQTNQIQNKLLSGGGGQEEGLSLPVSTFDFSKESTKMEVPPLPTLKINTKLLKQKKSRVPELCPGIVMRESENVLDGEVSVNCLGCSAQLRVNLYATLVKCSNCGTVSPATSTRRS